MFREGRRRLLYRRHDNANITIKPERGTSLTYMKALLHIISTVQLTTKNNDDCVNIIIFISISFV